MERIKVESSSGKTWTDCKPELLPEFHRIALDNNEQRQQLLDNLAVLVNWLATDPLLPIEFTYTNHRGVTEARRVNSGKLIYTLNDYHPGMQFVLHAFCLGRNDWRDFAVESMQDIR
jgi:predicted DNA-binding transcriptional regulator YafY